MSFSVAQAGLESTILSALITSVSHQSPHPGFPYVFKNQFFPTYEHSTVDVHLILLNKWPKRKNIEAFYNLYDGKLINHDILKIETTGE